MTTTRRAKNADFQGLALPLFAHAMRHVASQRAHAVLNEGSVAPKTVATGYTAVDAALTGGFAMGSTTLVAGRLGAGSTAFLLGATLAAVRRGVRVAYFSTRWRENQLRGRLVLLASRVNSFKLRAGFGGLEDQTALATARSEIPWSGLSLVASASLSVEQIEEHLFQYRPELAVIDALPRVSVAPQPYLCFADLVLGSAELARIADAQQVAVVTRMTLPQRCSASALTDFPGQGVLAEHYATVLTLQRDADAKSTVDGAPPTVGRFSLCRHRGAALSPPREVVLSFDQRYAGFRDPI